MKVSILMPTFNRPELLTNAVKAIIAQTHRDWELIIQDGGDSKITEELFNIAIVNEPRVHYFKGKDSGIADAVDKASKHITGDIIVWANDDDTLEPDALKYIVDNIEDAKWCYGDIQMVNEAGDQIGVMGGDYSYEVLKHGNYIPQPAVFITREAFDRVGGYATDLGTACDYEMSLKLGQYYTPTHFQKFFAKYLIHGGQWTNSQSAEQSESARMIRDKYKDINGV